MLLSDVVTLARSLMVEHGVGDWGLELDRARRRAGQADHTHHRITLSRHLMALYSEAEVRETVLHEIAHARTGASHGHDAAWRAEARRLGASGDRLVDARAPRVAGPWVGTCPAGHTVDRMRRPAAPSSCSRCAPRFSPEHLLTWSYDGAPVPHERMGPAYVRAYRRLRQSPPPNTPDPTDHEPRHAPPRTRPDQTQHHSPSQDPRCCTHP